MNQPIILFLIFMFSTSSLFSAAAASSSSSQVNMCKTCPKNPASSMLRALTFEMLKRSGYQHPEEIMLHNGIDTRGSPASASVGEKIIYFSEAHFQGYPHGIKIATIGHEVVHIKYRHRGGNKENERLADKEGLLLTACEPCGIEIAHHYAQCQKERLPYEKDYNSVFGHAKIPKSIAEFKLLTPQLQLGFMGLARSVSEIYPDYDTHPCDLERAFCLYRLSQKPPLKGKMCQFHKQKKEKRKRIVQRILREAQRQQKKRTGSCTIL